MIANHGPVVKAPTRYVIQAQFLSIAKHQAELTLQIASEFGFTPASRARITAPSQARTKDLFGNIPESDDG
jgi:phage terminase small subunit